MNSLIEHLESVNVIWNVLRLIERVRESVLDCILWLFDILSPKRANDVLLVLPGTKNGNWNVGLYEWIVKC